MDHFKIVIPLYYILLFLALYKDETCLLYIRTQCALRSKHNSVIQKQQVNVVQRNCCIKKKSLFVPISI